MAHHDYRDAKSGRFAARPKQPKLEPTRTSASVNLFKAAALLSVVEDAAGGDEASRAALEALLGPVSFS